MCSCSSTSVSFTTHVFIQEGFSRDKYRIHTSHIITSSFELIKAFSIEPLDVVSFRLCQKRAVPLKYPVEKTWAVADLICVMRRASPGSLQG